MGKPTILNRIVRIKEYILNDEATRRSETSKYPEEKKEKSIPLVAASEKGGAQTKKLASWGCRTLYTELQKKQLVEAAWKGPPKKVIVLYAKIVSLLSGS